jgi:hypothetical protein
MVKKIPSPDDPVWAIELTTRGGQFPYEVVAYARRLGILTLAELCIVRPPSMRGGWGEFQDILKKYGLPSGVQPESIPWDPPYSRDKEILDLWNTTLDSAKFGRSFLAKNLHEKGVHTIGAYIQSGQTSPSTSRTMHNTTTLGFVHERVRAFDPRLRAGMLVKNWQPPVHCAWCER